MLDTGWARSVTREHARLVASRGGVIGISPPSFLSYDDYGEWPSIGAALLALGRSREDVAKVMGGNFLRLLREVAAA